MYTRMPDWTQRSASSGVLSFFLYSISHDIVRFLLAYLTCPNLFRDRARPLVSSRSIENRAIEELIQQLQHFELSEYFDGALNGGFILQVLPEILFCQDNHPHQLAERDVLLGAAGANLAIAVIDIKLRLAQQPLAQVTINLVDSLLQFFLGYLAVIASQIGTLHLEKESGRERVGVSFNQADESVGQHHD